MSTYANSPRLISAHHTNSKPLATIPNRTTYKKRFYFRNTHLVNVSFAYGRIYLDEARILHEVRLDDEHSIHFWLWLCHTR